MVLAPISVVISISKKLMDENWKSRCRNGMFSASRIKAMAPPVTHFTVGFGVRSMLKIDSLHERLVKIVIMLATISVVKVNALTSPIL